MNPLIPTLNAADPAAHVWPGDDRLWLYTSHDLPGTNTCDTMDCYHVFSSSDLVNWTDHGVALHLKDVSWAVSHMWAIDAALWQGTYYLIYCAIERATGIFRTGLATSPRPEGPFTDIGFVHNVESGQDPSLFIDTDNTPYLFWGSGGRMHAAQLNGDLRSIVQETYIELTAQLTWAYEAPFIHTYQNKYYLTYPGLKNGQWPETMFYAIADCPLGPYTFTGEYIPRFAAQSGTNHGSVIHYKGQWLAFHHSSWMTGISECRSLMADFLAYDADGAIKPIVSTRDGVSLAGQPPTPSRVTILLDAAAGPSHCRQRQGTRVATTRPGYTGFGYVCGFDHQQYGVSAIVQSGIHATYRLYIRYVAPEGPQQNKILVNETLLDDPLSPDPRRYDKAHTFPQTSEWRELDAGLIHLRPGDNMLRLYRGTGGIEIDYFKLEPI